jgi:hypothetical protein
MKTPRFFYGFLAGGLVLGCIALWPHSGGAAISTNGPVGVNNGKAGITNAPSAAGTNATNSLLPIPVSAFNTDLSPTKDPFFPNTLRQPKRIVTGPKEVAGISATAFHLMALSGSTDERLAMINHRTLSVGESVEVRVPDGRKATIRLLQIKEKSVIIRVTSPPQPDLIELSLSKGAQ